MTTKNVWLAGLTCGALLMGLLMMWVFPSPDRAEAIYEDQDPVAENQRVGLDVAGGPLQDDGLATRNDDARGTNQVQDNNGEAHEAATLTEENPWVQGKIEVTIRRQPNPTQEPSVYVGRVFAIPQGALQASSVIRESESGYISKPWRGEETITLHIPKSGTWQVGLIGKWGIATPQDITVVANETSRATLTMPACGRIELVEAGPMPSDMQHRYGDVVVTAHQEGSSTYAASVPSPIRNRMRSVGVMNGGHAYLRGIVGGVQYDFTSKLNHIHGEALESSKRDDDLKPVYEFQFKPAIAQAGDRVEVSAVQLGRAELHLTAADELPSAAPLWLTLEFRRGTRVRQLMFGKADLPCGARLLLAPGTWTISFSAPWHSASPKTIKIESGTTTTHHIALRVDESKLKTRSNSDENKSLRDFDRALGFAPPSESEGVAIHVAPPGELNPGQKVCLWTKVKIPGNRTKLQQREQSTTTFLSDYPELQGAYAALGSWYSQRTPAGNYQRTLDLTLVPSGYLVVVPERPTPAGVGPLTLTLEDGSLIPKASKYGDRVGLSNANSLIEIEPGTMLGPLPAGTYSFTVWLGGTRMSAARAKVVAKRIRPLSIPLPR